MPSFGGFSINQKKGAFDLPPNLPSLIRRQLRHDLRFQKAGRTFGDSRAEAAEAKVYRCRDICSFPGRLISAVDLHIGWITACR